MATIELSGGTTRKSLSANTNYLLDWYSESEGTVKGYWHCNSGGNDGGAIYIGTNAVSLSTKDVTTGNEKVWFDRCDATGAGGGAVYIGGNHDIVTLQNAVFTKNFATKNGGAIQILGNNNRVYLQNVILDGNTTGTSGGAISISGTSTIVKIEGSTISNNVTSGAGYGAGVVVSGISSSDKNAPTVSFTNVLFKGNTCTTTATNVYGGGALKIVDGTVILSGCTFSDNVSNASVSGGLHLYNAIAMYHHGYQDNRELILKGQNYFGTDQYIYTSGCQVTFDLTDATYEDSQKAILNDYSLLYRADSDTGVNTNEILITVSAYQTPGTYIIAGNYITGTGTGSANKFHTDRLRIQCGSTTKEFAKLADGNSYTATQNINGTSYTLNVDTTTNNLVLTVGENFIFVNNAWKTGATVSGQTYHGIETPEGTCDNAGRYFNDYNLAVTYAKSNSKTIVGIEEKTPSYEASVQLKGVKTDLTKGNYTKMIVGGTANTSGGAKTNSSSSNLTISGGTYSSNVIGGNYASAAAVTDASGYSSNLAITGGTFSKVVCGGAYSNGAMVTSQATNLTISGGTFMQRVYGGNYAKTETVTSSDSLINGNVTVTVDCSRNAVSFNDGITVGSRGSGSGMIKGTTSITFTGNGANLSFGKNAKVWGGCTGDTRTIKSATGEITVTKGVTGTRTLVFDDFEGDFKATVGLFSDLQVVNGSSVNFAGARLGDVERWLIEAECSISGLGLNNFKGDTLNLYGVTDSELISGTSQSFNDFSSASKVYINGAACTYDSSNLCWHTNAKEDNLMASVVQVGSTEKYVLKLSAYSVA